MRYKLTEIANSASGKLYSGSDVNTCFTTLTSDSREVEGNKNVLFVALRGDRFDGHDFVKDVCELPKTAAIIDDERYFTKNTILVRNVKRALFDVALKYRYSELSKVKCVAVTGSVGKTSTKEMVSLVFESGKRVYKSPGNKNSLTGLPMVILNASSEYETMILEVGMNMPDEISKLSLLTKPNIAIITNIGWSHIEAFGSKEAIMKEKLDIAASMSADGTVILNGDDELLREGAKTLNVKTVLYSVKDSTADVYAENIREVKGETEFVLHLFDETYEVRLPYIGVHKISNALAALAAGKLSGIDTAKAIENIKNFKGGNMRQETYVSKGVYVISDCYNAAPESMKAAIKVLASHDCEGKRIAVLGDMLELGDFSEQLHAEVGKCVAEANPDVLVCVGERGRTIASSALKSGLDEDKIVCFDENERSEAAEYLSSVLRSGDVVLFKASNRMRFWEIEKKAELRLG